MKTTKFLFGVALAVLMIGCDDDRYPIDDSYAKPEENYITQGNRKPIVDIVFIHGMAVNNESWSAQVEYFESRRRVININLPYVGCVAETKSPFYYDFQMLADIVHETLSQAKVSQALIVGHSSGFAVAKELAIRHPNDVKKIINVDFEPFFYPAEGSPERDSFVQFMENAFLPGICAGVMKEVFLQKMCPEGITPDCVRDYVWCCMSNFPSELGCNLFTELTRESLFCSSIKCTVPVLSIHAKEMDDAFKQRMRSSFPAIEFVSMPFPSGHFIQMEYPDLFNELVENFAFR
jgi:pimeloyl-ACP methyl ester carboxylesterase